MPRSSNYAARILRFSRFAGLVVLVASVGGRLVACPFCTPVGPSLAARREAAEVVLLAEVRAVESAGARLVPRKVFKGERTLGPRLSADTDSERTLNLTRDDLPDRSLRPGDLLLVFGDAAPAPAGNGLQWSHYKVQEVAIAYFARSPSLREPAVARLRWFARYLEHDEPLIAEDAYLELAHAPYDAVAQVADTLDMSRLRHWLGAAAVPDSRKGLYGLLLGLAVRPADKAANEALLRQIIEAQCQVTASSSLGRDFRGGFDGALGGYLALTGSEGLDLLDALLLSRPDAAEGNLRHAITALRFAHEYLPQISRDRLGRSLRLLLARPGFAAATIVDLARWRDEAALDQVVALYDVAWPQQPAIRQAVVGYLLALDTVQSAKALAKLQARDPAGVSAAEEHIRQFPAFGAAAGLNTTRE
jgi:hypothetical protein